MMSKRERIHSIGLGITSVATLGLLVKHFVSPSQATLAVIGILTACSSVILGISAYDWIKEGLTGERQ